MPSSSPSSRPVPGIDAAIELRRDAYGIPHVRAQTVADAFFAQGWVHAQDRLWQMERDRRLAQGRWAEVAGQGALSADLLARQLRLAWAAERDYLALSADARAVLEAYARGVNASIAALSELPRDFRQAQVAPEPWLPWHSIAVFLQRHLNMGGWEAKVWRAHLRHTHGAETLARWYAPFALPDTVILRPKESVAATGTSPELTASLLDLLRQGAADGDASNNWAVAGRHTRSGLPLLAGDPHRMLEVPNVYYQNHLTCPDFDATGISMPGVPGMPHFGHNPSVAWCLTHGMADTGDFYVESPDTMVVAYQGRAWVAVRGEEPVAVDVVVTENGAVIGPAPAEGRSLSLRLPELAEPNSSFEALLPMLQARSAAALGEAMRPWVAPCQNLVMADLEGHIAYRLRGRLPIRHRLNAYLPVPAGEDEFRWRGFVPFEEMPTLTDPPTGWIATANNRMTPDGYPHYVATLFSEHRAHRIAELLDGREGLTRADMERIHADVVSLPAKEALALLPGVEPATAAGREARSLLAAWDGQMRADSAAALVYSAWREAVVLRLLAGVNKAPGLSAVAIVGAIAMPSTVRARLWELAATGDDRLLADGATWPSVLAEGLDAAAADLAARSGGDMAGWRWGDLHRLPAGGGLGGDTGPFGFGLPGDPDTVRAAGYLLETGFQQVSGSVARYAFDLGDWDASGWVLPHGIGGDADHPHFADQVQAWRDAALVPMLFSEQAVDAATRSRLDLVPKA
jgi:penicillin G amidase